MLAALDLLPFLTESCEACLVAVLDQLNLLVLVQVVVDLIASVPRKTKERTLWLTEFDEIVGFRALKNEITASLG
jgi:hypothetical protein